MTVRRSIPVDKLTDRPTFRQQFRNTHALSQHNPKYYTTQIAIRQSGEFQLKPDSILHGSAKLLLQCGSAHGTSKVRSKPVHISLALFKCFCSYQPPASRYATLTQERVYVRYPTQVYSLGTEHVELTALEGCAESSVRTQQFITRSRNSPQLIEPEKSFPSSQQPATCLHREPDQSLPGSLKHVAMFRITLHQLS